MAGTLKATRALALSLLEPLNGITFGLQHPRRPRPLLLLPIHFFLRLARAVLKLLTAREQVATPLRPTLQNLAEPGVRRLLNRVQQLVTRTATSKSGLTGLPASAGHLPGTTVWSAFTGRCD